MDIVTKLNRLTRRLPFLLYARRAHEGGVIKLILAFRDDPELRSEYFDTIIELDRFWAALVRVMTEQCSSPCIVFRDVFFQPSYVQRLIKHSNELAHFVVIDFGQDRNVALGHTDIVKRDAFYDDLTRSMGLPPDVGNTDTPIH